MALSSNRIVYGIHNMTPYKRADRMPYGILKVIGGGSLSFAAETEKLFGGSQRFAFASEAKTIDSTFTATVKSMPDFLFELYLGASVSTTAASASGSITQALTNVKGTAMVSTTGIATATIESGEEAQLKDGVYVVQAASATTVDVFAFTDIAFGNGTNLDFVNDALKITTTALTITSSTAVSVPNTGIELTGGSGTIALGSAGDNTAYYRVSAAHGGISTMTIGQSTTTFPEHGMVCLSARRSDGSLFELDLLKVVGSGFPIALEETVFSIPELTVDLLYDSVQNAVAKVTATTGA